MAITKLFSELREISHAGAAFIGTLALSAGAIAMTLKLVGVDVAEEDVAQSLMALGGGLTAISKAIDSANDAIVKRKRK